ncbi:MAG: 2-oxoglutarate dehydrogenase E1 component [Chlamydiales bacterium]|nr:2-oxoglutarate dehydrogenase E1 component [Chlamydiales bacterium]
MLPNLIYIEKLYSAFQEDPESVDTHWRSFFRGMELGSSLVTASSDERVKLLIQAYRLHGHQLAQFNPFSKIESVQELKLESFGFSDSDLTSSFSTFGLLPTDKAPLSEILDRLKALYASKIGYENIQGLENLIEKEQMPLSADEQRRILHELNRSELFEAFLHTKYTGQKRFSLEGGETLIPILAEILNHGSEQGLTEAVIGMAHRGRLNVLTNIMGKSYASVFAEFLPDYVPQEGDGSGDVKYHKGFSADYQTPNGKQLKLLLAANPSHLEAVDPVVEGIAYAKQTETEAVLPILIHGDASVAGQGVVYETLQLSKIEGYATGGTIHIVVNNQIGFTAVPKESRSTRYCTAIAASFNAPVFHVNAEDPDSCIQAAKLAIVIRQTLGLDVFIDLNCYRKYGHNEGDEPTYTQPLLYANIKAREKIRVLYRKQLIAQGVLSEQEANALETEFKTSLEAELKSVEELKIGREFMCPVPTDKPYPETGVSKDVLMTLGQQICQSPEGTHPKLKRILDERLQMLTGAPLDWGMAEMLAYATLLKEGIPVRLSGQDSIRGTFSHRHAGITHQQTEQRTFPLNQIGGAKFCAYNSPLSEYAVLCFEFGYSLVCQRGLTIWEAQFGDFANGAQIAIDQFIATSEQKWRETAPLVLMLPHGYEGQGPEHSSARIERFLQLGANHNMLICNNTTPAQIFHLLRAHCQLKERRPLVIFMPKALLRYAPSLSHIDALAQGRYQKVIDDAPRKARKLLFCSGKVYYDLIEEREKRNLTDIAIVRIEQLYPFPKNEIKALLANYKDVKQIFWVQEEHQNMGAWTHIHFEMGGLTAIGYIGRPKSASPAAGFPTLHKRELEAFLNEAMS